MTEWLSAIGSFGQFIVVLAAALFAVVQLRQIRRQVDLQSIEPLFSFSRTEEFQGLIDAVRALHAAGPEAWTDRSRWESTEFRKVVRFGALGNEVGTLVAARLLPQDLFTPIFRPYFLLAWDVLGPWLAEYRHGNPAMTIPRFAAFEALIVRTSTETDIDRFAQMRAALPPAIRERYTESNARVRALYDATHQTTTASQTESDSENAT